MSMLTFQNNLSFKIILKGIVWKDLLLCHWRKDQKLQRINIVSWMTCSNNANIGHKNMYWEFQNQLYNYDISYDSLCSSMSC
jgi:hypothetical protein